MQDPCGAVDLRVLSDETWCVRPRKGMGHVPQAHASQCWSAQLAGRAGQASTAFGPRVCARYCED